MINLIPFARRRGEQSDTGSLMDLRSEMDRAFDRFFDLPAVGWPTVGMSQMWAPPLEIYDEDQNLVIRTELPGIDPDEIEISVADNVLTIAGEKREENKENRDGVYRSEVRYGRFLRALELPRDVDTNKIETEYDNGVLTLRIPRTEQRQAKRIPVSAGAGRRQISQGQGQGQQERGQQSRQGQEAMAGGQSSQGESSQGQRQSESGSSRRSRS